MNREKFIEVMKLMNTSNHRLAKKAGVATNTVRNFVKGFHHPNDENQWRFINKGIGIATEQFETNEALEIIQQMYYVEPKKPKFKVVTYQNRANENIAYGKSVEERRIKRDPTRGEFAKISGVPYHIIHQIENGVKVSIKHKEMIEKVFNV